MNTFDLVAISPWLAPSLPAGAPPPAGIPSTLAKERIGQKSTVKGCIVEVLVLEKVAYLNFDAAHPQTPFTAVLFGPKTQLFGDLRTLQGKTVEVSGQVIDFKGRPEIVISEKTQMRILPDAPAGRG